MKPTTTSLETKIQQAGHEHRLGRGLVGAEELSVTFRTPSVEDKPVYSRLGNTANHAELESLLAALHNADSAIATGSGMSCETLLFLSLAKSGDHVLCQDICYGGTYKFLTEFLERWNVTTTFAPVAEWAKHIRPETKFVFAETISNPFCEPQDLHAVAAFAKSHNLISICDNTFASPILCRPLDIGINIVFESATKYLNGHSDVIAGVVLSKDKNLMDQMRSLHAYLGTFLPATSCSQLIRGLKTLKVRMDAHTRHGQQFAIDIKALPQVKAVHYGTANDDARSSLFANGFGGMVAVAFQSNVNMTAFLKSLTLIADVPSLGGTETTATSPAYTTNWFMTSEQKKKLGITPHLIRFSIGLEDPKDLIADIQQALRNAT